MALSIYLAMTAWEVFHLPMPKKCGWMACHFSAYGSGLTNIPKSLPKGSMLILNDRIPPAGHDPALVARQLSGAVQALSCSCVLMDFQRPYHWQTAQICSAICAELKLPLGITAPYAAKFQNCSVFLPPLPPCTTLNEYLSPWKGRDIWLELSADAIDGVLSSKGCEFLPASIDSKTYPFHDPALHCHYRIQCTQDQVIFTTMRTKEDIGTLLEEAGGFGVSTCVGLYQQLQDVLFVQEEA